MPFGNAVGEGFNNGLVTKLTVADLGPGDGIFVYSTAAPAAGTLLYSVTAAGGTDAAGNVFFGGATNYFTSGGVSYAVQVFAGAVTWLTAASQAGPYSQQGQLLIANPGVAPGTLFINFAAIEGTLNIPQTHFPIIDLPQDTNSGSTWVSGERAFMNGQWVDPINNNFAAIDAALTAAGIW